MIADFIKINGALYPASEEAQEYLKKVKEGEAVTVTLKRIRNYQFLKKWFSLVKYGFELWSPDFEGEKNFERFRRDITILAGFYEQTVRLNGEIRTEAKSISFGSMSADEFEELYGKTIDVLIKYVCSNYTGDELRAVVDTIETFE